MVRKALIFPRAHAVTFSITSSLQSLLPGVCDHTAGRANPIMTASIDCSLISIQGPLARWKLWPVRKKKKKRITPFLSELIRWGDRAGDSLSPSPAFGGRKPKGPGRCVTDISFPFRDRSNVPKRPRCSLRKYQTGFASFSHEAAVAQRLLRPNKRYFRGIPSDGVRPHAGCNLAILKCTKYF